MVFENRPSKERHLDSAQFKACMAELDGALASFSVNEMTQIG
ncbi:hypothetical protein [Pontiella sp.]